MSPSFQNTETLLHIKGILSFITSIYIYLYIFETKTCFWSLQPSLQWWAEVLCRWNNNKTHSIQSQHRERRECKTHIWLDTAYKLNCIYFSGLYNWPWGRNSLAFCCFLSPDLLTMALSPAKDCVLLAVAPYVYCWTHHWPFSKSILPLDDHSNKRHFSKLLFIV